MNKVKFYRRIYFWELEKEVEDFSEKHEILSISINSENSCYIAAIVYKDKE